jgi:hypothetical protein
MRNFKILKVGPRFFMPVRPNCDSKPVMFMEMNSMGTIVNGTVLTKDDVQALADRDALKVREIDNLFAAVKEHFAVLLNGR